MDSQRPRDCSISSPGDALAYSVLLAGGLCLPVIVGPDTFYYTLTSTSDTTLSGSIMLDVIIFT